jgi:CarD family transcriptional regulator
MDEGLEVSGMKATAGTARSGREAAALRQAAPQRVIAKPAAKAAQAVTARKTAPGKPTSSASGKSTAPAKKAPAVSKVPAAKQASAKPTATKPVAAKPAVPKSVAEKPVTAKPGTGKPVVAKPIATESVATAAVTTAAPKAPAAPLQAGPPKATPAAPRPVPAQAPSPVAAAPAPSPIPVQAPVAAAPSAISAPPADRRPMMPDRPPARPMAKAEIFVEGDHVVYPTHGVGKVERIATEEIAGHKLELIHITFEENRMTLRVPVAKARTAGLRKLATRKLFDEALAVLKGRARIKRTMWSRRAQEYEAKINSGDPLSIAEVVRDLHRNAGQPDQSFSERQIYEAAMDRLAAELAALDKTDKLTAASKLANFLKTV